MTVTRQRLANYLHEQFSDLAAAVGQLSDPINGYKPDIDNALRKLGTSEGDLATATVEDGSRDACFALAEYYAAYRFWRQLSGRVDVRLGESTFTFHHMVANAEKVMKDAAKRCAALGIDVTGGGWSIGWLNLDWIENESVL